MVCMGKLDEVLEMMKVNELLGKKEEKKDNGNTVLWILAIIGAIAAVAGIAYAVYRYLTPDYLEDFDDDFDDDSTTNFLKMRMKKAPIQQKILPRQMMPGMMKKQVKNK